MNTVRVIRSHMIASCCLMPGINHSGARQVSGKILGFGFQTGSQMLVKRRQVVRITSGSETLDTLLGGGTVVVSPLFLSQLLI